MSSAAVFPDLQLFFSNLQFYLLFDIGFYYLAVDTDCADEISSCPYVHAPISFAHFRKLFTKIFRAFTLEHLHHQRWWMLGWYWHIHVDMIWTNGAFYLWWYQAIRKVPSICLLVGVLPPRPIFGIGILAPIQNDTRIGIPHAMIFDSLPSVHLRSEAITNTTTHQHC